LPDTGQVSIFFLVLMRALAFMLSGPLFTIKGIPTHVKIGFSLVLAVVVYPLVAAGQGPLPLDAWSYGLAVVSETGFGLLLGLAVTIVLSSVRMAGQFIDHQIGYSMSSIMDPLNMAQNTLLSQYLYLLALVFYLMIDGHHSLIVALTQSYQLVPLTEVSLNGSVTFIMIKIFSGAFATALQVSAPILAVLLVADLTLGFLARTVPQINVFMTGFPVKIAVGVLTLSFLIPLLGAVLRTIFDTIEKDLYTLMKALV